jgi:hypothetical protein
MMEDKNRPAVDPPPAAANDNRGAKLPVSTLMDEAVLQLARLLGRQIAREHFTAMQAVNDNAPGPKRKA